MQTYDQYKEEVYCYMRYSPACGDTIADKFIKDGFRDGDAPCDVADQIDIVFEQHGE